MSIDEVFDEGVGDLAATFSRIARNGVMTRHAADRVSQTADHRSLRHREGEVEAVEGGKFVDKTGVSP
jgi:hypothetical protein